MVARPARHRYGEHRSQVAELFLPDGDGPHPVAVLIHGGFWRHRYNLRLEHAVARDLQGRGWAVWNVEYRRLHGDGGWPETFADVGAAIDLLVELDAPLDLDRAVSIGHSAGGHLALWAAGRPRLPDGAPGAAPRVRMRRAVAKAGAADLEEVARLELSEGAAADLMGGHPHEVPERYALASPVRLLPLGVPLLLVHGEADQVVPASLSVRFAEAARAAGDDCELVLVPGEGHRAHLDPCAEVWRAVVAWLGK